MTIAALKIKNFRNLDDVEIFPSASVNIISGANGSGKTSLLEAIYYLGLGRSFRTATPARLIRNSCSKFSLFGEIINFNQQKIAAGIEREATGASRIRIAENELNSVSELASLLPLRLINAHSHQLFEAGPSFRRKYLDWGIFYHQDNFLTVWRHFERAMKQRNILLKEKRLKKEIDVWSNELVKYALELNTLRKEYVINLLPHFHQLVESLLECQTLSISYQSGWDETLDLLTILDQSFYDECRLGSTQFGPHRADLEISLNNVLMKHFLSRGQQKLLICAMIIAQGMLFNQALNRGLIYLIDDLPSELDPSSRKKLISLLIEQQSQIFITSIESEMITCELANIFNFNKSMKVFHVEQGKVREVSSLPAA